MVSLDDVYPGWDGLDAGSHHVYRSVIEPLLGGEIGRYRRWDWSLVGHGEWVEVFHPTLVIIEGCGAIRREAPQLSSELYWLEAPEEVRRLRTRERDGDTFQGEWQRWALQEQRFLALHDSRGRASSILSTTDDIRGVSNGA